MQRWKNQWKNLRSRESHPYFQVSPGELFVSISCMLAVQCLAAEAHVINQHGQPQCAVLHASEPGRRCDLCRARGKSFEKKVSIVSMLEKLPTSGMPLVLQALHSCFSFL